MKLHRLADLAQQLLRPLYRTQMTQAMPFGRAQRKQGPYLAKPQGFSIARISANSSFLNC